MKKIAYAASLCLIFTSCGGSEDKKDMHEEDSGKEVVRISHYDQAGTNKDEDGPVKKAQAIVQAKSDSEVVGAVTFTVMDDGLRIVADVGSLTPGKHGFHIHEHGDCSAHDGTSAGGHFNPHNKKHGGPDSEEHHAGDLGNLEANKFGFAHYDRVFTDLYLNDEYSIIGKSIVIHEGEDDLVTNPTGNSGKRIGCGAITNGEY